MPQSPASFSDQISGRIKFLEQQSHCRAGGVNKLSLVGSPRKSHLTEQKRAMILQELMDRGQLYFRSILSALCGCFVGLFSSKEDEMLQFKSATSIGAY